MRNRLEDLFDNDDDLSDEDSLSINDEKSESHEKPENLEELRNNETDEICETFRGTVSQPQNLIESGKPSENQPIIADLGSMWSRLGFSSEEKPKVIQR